ncbi:hypothetical protein P3S68_006764 [Capsicum galapagoense]
MSEMEDGMSDIANFGFSNSSRDQNVEEQIQENVGEISEESKGDKGKDEGGLINRLISNLMSPRAGEARNKERNYLFEVTDEDRKKDIASKVEEKSGNDDSGGGRIINNLISNIESSKEKQEDRSSGEKQKDVMKKTEEDTASVLGNILSHLPIPLADDAVPATDEASILIHSVVHD